ncbi:hypothetical protein V5N11_000738 [Cardamine amara subsp. amara]|uniref:DUF1985 domain-containing protein n=1 Tax=Cardamine amara subsp. amara TaxID=228776 RepID=A0ABD0ZCB7_CARAN
MKSTEQDKSTSLHTKDTQEDSEPLNQSSSDEHTASTAEETEESQPLPPQKFYFSHTNFHEAPSITARCDPGKTVEYLQKLLSKQERRWFSSNPQFKHIWHMYMELNRKLMGMWVLLLRTACTKKKKVAWFVVNGCPIRYSLREHGLICGLDCHEYPPEYKKEKLGSYDFVTRIFGKKRVEVAEVKKKLDSMKGPEDGDRLQVAVLYFLSKIIRGTKKVVGGSIDKFILQIVNDLEDCKSFPWGRMSFDDSLEAIEDLVHNSGGKVKSYMTFPCFIIPLETLIFECIPDLCRRYRDDVKDAKESCPRMCRKRFKASGMKGYPLENVNEALGTIKVLILKVVSQPENQDESQLMLRLLDRIPDDETDNVDMIVDNINKVVESGKKQIWWENLFKLDVAGRGIVKEVVEQEEQQNVHKLGAAEAEHQQQQSDQGGFKALAEMMDAGFKGMRQMFEGLEKRMTVLEGRSGLGGRDDMTGCDENPVVADDGEKEKGYEVVAGENERENENEVVVEDEEREAAGDEEIVEENEVVAGDKEREAAGDKEREAAGDEEMEEENEVVAGENMERAMVLYTRVPFTEDEGEGSRKRKFAEEDEDEGPKKKKAYPRKKKDVRRKKKDVLIETRSSPRKRTTNPSQFCKTPWTQGKKKKT